MDERSTRIDELLAIMDRLRDPENGCPWDVKQTPGSIVPFTIEEAYEVADAVDRGDEKDLKDELGDLLLQVVFQARMAQERRVFDFGDVVSAICTKMVGRHPHVFADERIDDAEAQTAAWEGHKRREREQRADGDTSVLAGIARGLPEWQRSIKLQKRAATVGFDWPAHHAVLEKLREEIEEVRAEFRARDLDPDDAQVRDRLEDEIGDLLFVCANLARHAEVDVGGALRRANRKFERRFRRMEELARQEGTELSALPLDAQEDYWQRAKLVDG